MPKEKWLSASGQSWAHHPLARPLRDTARLKPPPRESTYSVRMKWKSPSLGKSGTKLSPRPKLPPKPPPKPPPPRPLCASIAAAHSSTPPITKMTRPCTLIEVSLYPDDSIVVRVGPFPPFQETCSCGA